MLVALMIPEQLEPTAAPPAQGCRARFWPRSRRPPAPPVDGWRETVARFWPRSKPRPAPVSRRKLRPGARPRSLGVRPLDQRERRQLATDERALRRLEVLQTRPRTFAECEGDPRPCPWVSCVHHLYLEVDEDTGIIKVNFPDRDVDEIPATCSLKVAEQRGALSLEEVGKLVNLTQERVSQIEEGAMAKAKRRSER